MRAYKLCEIDRFGQLYSLFIDKSRNRKPKPLVPNVWLEAEFHPTKGFAARKGWHCCPSVRGAPHLSKNPKTGRRRVWVVVEIEEVESFDRPESQGGNWLLAQRMRIVTILQSDGDLPVEEVVGAGLPREDFSNAA